MAQMDGFDYDEYQVYADIPKDADLAKIINAGLEALGYPKDPTMEVNWIDSHYI